MQRFDIINNLIKEKDVKLKFEKEEFYTKVTLGSHSIQEYSGGTFTFPDATFLDLTRRSIS